MEWQQHNLNKHYSVQYFIKNPPELQFSVAKT